MHEIYKKIGPIALKQQDVFELGWPGSGGVPIKEECCVLNKKIKHTDIYRKESIHNLEEQLESIFHDWEL